MMEQRSFHHMLDRMKKDLIAIKIDSNDKMESLKDKKLIVKDEFEKSQKAREQHLQAKFKLDTLMKNIDKEQEKRQGRIKSLQKSIKNKEDAVQRRMDRANRQKQIANDAAAENKDSEEEKKREEFMVQHIWGVFLKKKMESEMGKSKGIEDAFQKIRNATGLSDVSDIVQKFLQREETYGNLLIAVSDSEKKIDILKKDNDGAMENLHQLMINRDQMPGTKNFPETQKLTTEISDLKKELDESSERSQKIEIVKDQIYGWVQKVLQKMENIFQSSGTSDFNLDKLEDLKKIANLEELFKTITEVVNDQLEKIIREEGQEEKYISSREFMNDFASQEYIDKNIRIRPASGKSQADDGKLGFAGGASGQMKEDGGEEDENDLKMINLEMEEQRKDIK